MPQLNQDQAKRLAYHLTRILVTKPKLSPWHWEQLEVFLDRSVGRGDAYDQESMLKKDLVLQVALCNELSLMLLSGFIKGQYTIYRESGAEDIVIFKADANGELPDDATKLKLINQAILFLEQLIEKEFNLDGRQYSDTDSLWIYDEGLTDQAIDALRVLSKTMDPHFKPNPQYQPDLRFVSEGAQDILRNKARLAFLERIRFLKIICSEQEDFETLSQCISGELRQATEEGLERFDEQKAQAQELKGRLGSSLQRAGATVAVSSPIANTTHAPEAASDNTEGSNPYATPSAKTRAAQLREEASAEAELACFTPGTRALLTPSAHEENAKETAVVAISPEKRDESGVSILDLVQKRKGNQVEKGQLLALLLVNETPIAQEDENDVKELLKRTYYRDKKEIMEENDLLRKANKVFDDVLGHIDHELNGFWNRLRHGSLRKRRKLIFDAIQSIQTNNESRVVLANLKKQLSLYYTVGASRTLVMVNAINLDEAQEPDNQHDRTSVRLDDRFRQSAAADSPEVAANADEEPYLASSPHPVPLNAQHSDDPAIMTSRTCTPTTDASGAESESGVIEEHKQESLVDPSLQGLAIKVNEQRRVACYTNVRVREAKELLGVLEAYLVAKEKQYQRYIGWFGPNSFKESLESIQDKKAKVEAVMGQFEQSEQDVIRQIDNLMKEINSKRGLFRSKSADLALDAKLLYADNRARFSHISSEGRAQARRPRGSSVSSERLVRT